ncbi:MAG: FAD-binding oxidoreductase, partial [Gemmatimonadetes bacterium]|nr:FAD-binding oxidoreductase [Gemmatimonadota bacterium]
MVHRSASKRLSPAGFRGAVIEAERAASYARGEGALVIPPEGAVRPADPDDLALLVRWAAENRRPLVPRGAGTGIPGGNIGKGIIVHLAESFGRIGAPDIDSRTIEVGASAVAGEVDRAARAAGLFLPPLPSSADRCTIGGMIANNAAGARSLRYGAIREWVEALDVILATGDRLFVTPTSAPLPHLARFRWTAEIGPDGSPASWPRVRKNSSGYALDRYLATRSPVHIFVGSEGTLAFVVAARLRLQPLPPARALAAVALSALEGIPRVAEAAMELGAAACELFGQRFLRLAAPQVASHFAVPLQQYAAVLLIELEAGDAHTIDDHIDSLRRVSSETDAAVLRVATTSEDVERLWEFRHAASPTITAALERGVVPLRFIEDSVVPADRVPDYLHGVQRLLAE